jgi:hypothetical protein
MGQSRHQSNHHRKCEFLGQIEGSARHIVGFLLVGGFQTGNHGEVGEIAAVLFVLTGVHSRIVGYGQNQAAFDIQECGVHKGIGGYVESDMLHRHQRAAAAEGSAQRFFESCLFIGAPTGLGSAVFIGRRRDEQIFHDFGRRGAGIAVCGADAGMQGAEGDGLVAE